MWMARRPDTERDTIGGQRPNGIMPVAGDLTSTVPTTTVDPAHVRTELLTVPVARRTFSLLLRDGGITREEILQQFKVDLARMDEDDARIVRGVTDSLREALLLTETDGATVPLTVRDLERINYYVTEANVYTEFHHVASETFREEMNWGRVMSFLLFAVSFSVYSLRQGMPDSTVQSIHGWTVGVLRREPVSTFLAANNGWVRLSGNIYVYQEVGAVFSQS